MDIRIWEGNHNKKFFHHFANQGGNRNAIWRIEGGDGVQVYIDATIHREGELYFHNLFKVRQEIHIEDLIWGVEEYPTNFYNE